MIKSSNGDATKSGVEQRKRGRWDQTIDEQFVPAKKSAGSATPTWGDVEVIDFIPKTKHSIDYKLSKLMHFCLQSYF